MEATPESTSSVSKTSVMSSSYSRTVEYKDGKRVETVKGYKCENGNWFSLNSDGSWTPSTKEKALENTSIKTIENGKSDSKEIVEKNPRLDSMNKFFDNFFKDFCD